MAATINDVIAAIDARTRAMDDLNAFVLSLTRTVIDWEREKSLAVGAANDPTLEVTQPTTASSPEVSHAVPPETARVTFPKPRVSSNAPTANLIQGA